MFIYVCAWLCARARVCVCVCVCGCVCVCVREREREREGGEGRKRDRKLCVYMCLYILCRYTGVCECTRSRTLVCGDERFMSVFLYCVPPWIAVVVL
jgi:hypothetical protein